MRFTFIGMAFLQIKADVPLELFIFNAEPSFNMEANRLNQIQLKLFSNMYSQGAFEFALFEHF